MTQPSPHNHDALTLSLPEALKEIPGWLVHRQKVPYYSNGANRGTNGTPADRANLSTFNDALARLKNGGNYSGLGLAMLPDWGIVALDFDDKQGEGLHPLAAEAERLTYCEISPSGKGRRAFFQGSMPDISLPGKIEIFHGSRYVTVTGNRINTLDIEPLSQDFADKLRAAITGNRTTPGQRQAISQTFIDDKTKAELRSALASMRADDRDLWQRMGHALKTIGDEGRALWLEWSQTSEKYNAADASRVWESFKPTSTGHQAVFAEAQRQGWLNPLAGATPQEQGNEPGGDPVQSVDLICGSDIKPEPVEWFWDGWLAAGKVHILGGAPGTGKTSIAMALAATVTTGGRWPDGTRSPVGNVVIWSGEDAPEDVLVPRLLQSDADVNRVYFVGDVRENGEKRSFDPARDIKPLRRKLAVLGSVKLLIVDPIVSAVAGDSHKNAEVRRSLQPLADLAASMRFALVGITHFSKGTSGREPVERLTGSLAFGALARVVMVAAKHQEQGEDGRTTRVFIRAKSNIGPDDGGFEYGLHQAELKTHPGIFVSSVLWGKVLEGSAREILATADTTGDDGEGGTLPDAKQFLSDLLSDGPMPVNAIKADANGAGYSWATIKRAKKALGIKPSKEGMKSGWVWQMPGREAAKTILENAKMLKNPEDAQQKEVSTFGKIEHLRDESDMVEVEI